MAGHSKWANIKFRKAAQDKKRGKLFTKLIREITVAAREGGGDLDSNPRLRQAVDKALRANMTRDAVDRAVKRGAGGDDDTVMMSVLYEGYGSNGVAVLVDCLTDNKNRTVAEVRHAFTKHGGNLGTDGSVAYLFTKIGQIVVGGEFDEEELLDKALELDCVEAFEQDGNFLIELEPANFMNAVTKLEEAKYKLEFAEVIMKPSTTVDLDTETSEKVLKMIDLLEDLDDVQEVSTNANFAEDATV